MNIKGLNKLNKTISAQLKRFGIASATFGDCYEYFYESETIHYQITEGSLDDILFVEFLKERFGISSDFPFLLFLLHEVGHHVTNDCLSDEIVDFCLTEKDRITAEMETAETVAAVTRLENQYFNLPDEIMATQWAVNYFKNHPKTIETMTNTILKAFHEFYKINNVREG